jgi:teichuronic acid biosynthesis glycosyltransferase TuaG
MPLVSVVIPTWNAARYMRDTLDSVFAQSYPNWEIVAVDDCSRDGTLDILRGYGERVRVIVRKFNSGTADIPRYEGVAASRGSLVALLDSDDMWEPRKLERQVTFMMDHANVPLSHHYMRMIDAEGRALYVRHEGVIPATGPCARPLLARCFICTSAVMVRREAWLAAQSLEQITTYGTEWDFLISIARKASVGFIPDVLGSYRYFADSISRKNWRRYPRDVGAMERIYDKGLWRDIVSQREMRALIYEACLESADAHRDRGDAWRSLYFGVKALQYRATHPGGWMRLAKGVARACLITRPLDRAS